MDKTAIIKTFKKQKALFLLALPAIIVVIVFSYLPMYGIIMAFQDFDVIKGLFGSKWVGLYWFETLLKEPAFYKVLGYTFYVSLTMLFFGFPMPIIFALLLNELKNLKFKKFVQTVSYLPHFISWVIISGIVYMLLLPSGSINVLLGKLFHIEPIPFLYESKYFVWIVWLSHLWKEVGYASILYLAALSAIDPQLYEAGVIDGAGRWKLTWHITLPALLPTAIVLFIMNTGNLMTLGFDMIWNLQNSAIREDTHVMDTYIYIEAMKYSKYSYGTAVGLFKGVIALTLISIANFASKKVLQLSLW